MRCRSPAPGDAPRAMELYWSQSIFTVRFGSLSFHNIKSVLTPTSGPVLLRFCSLCGYDKESLGDTTCHK